MNGVFAAIAVVTLLALAPAQPARAQTVDDPYSIMKPEPGSRQPRPVEPWLAPKYQPPRGSHRHVRVPLNTEPDVRAPPAVPPPIYVPDTGRLLPNLPALPGAGAGGAETGQDRAMRCAHQAGVYGQAAGNRDAYVGGCINQ
jgi:hypothetical protein